ncbi:uncharacterized protein [Panulirus ornatus]|uniref:uncharacterized protein n=1 Tax=Panulirus ornatus TaxID=150431 RepID=UPI003A8B75E0
MGLQGLPWRRGQRLRPFQVSYVLQELHDEPGQDYPPSSLQVPDGTAGLERLRPQDIFTYRRHHAERLHAILLSQVNNQHHGTHHLHLSGTHHQRQGAPGRGDRPRWRPTSPRGSRLRPSQVPYAPPPIGVSS